MMETVVNFYRKKKFEQFPQIEEKLKVLLERRPETFVNISDKRINELIRNWKIDPAAEEKKIMKELR
jgi:peptidyl-tRNA hydrolase